MKRALLLAAVLAAPEVAWGQHSASNPDSSTNITRNQGYSYVDEAAGLIRQDMVFYLAGKVSAFDWSSISQKPIAVDAPFYWRDWRINAAQANQKYPIQVPVLVTGRIVSVSKRGGEFYVDFASSPSGIDDVEAHLNSDAIGTAATFRPSQLISLVCRRDERTFQPFDLVSCQTVDGYALSMLSSSYQDIDSVLIGEDGDRLKFDPKLQKVLLYTHKCSLFLRKKEGDIVSEEEMNLCSSKGIFNKK